MLVDNKLEGTIPKEIGNLSNLEKLDFGDNFLTGLVPTEVGLIGQSLLALHFGKCKYQLIWSPILRSC